MKHKLKSRLLGEISITSEMQMIAPYQTKIMASGPITLWQIDEETVEIVTDYFGVLQNHCR